MLMRQLKSIRLSHIIIASSSLLLGSLIGTFVATKFIVSGWTVDWATWVLLATMIAIIWYAGEARKQAEATKQIAEASERPFIFCGPPVISTGWQENQEVRHLGLHLRNIGKGPAIYPAAQLILPSLKEPIAPDPRGGQLPTALLPNETAPEMPATVRGWPIAFRLPEGLDLTKPISVELHVKYEDTNRLAHDDRWRGVLYQIGNQGIFALFWMVSGRPVITRNITSL